MMADKEEVTLLQHNRNINVMSVLFDKEEVSLLQHNRNINEMMSVLI